MAKKKQKPRRPSQKELQKQLQADFEDLLIEDELNDQLLEELKAQSKEKILVRTKKKKLKSFGTFKQENRITKIFIIPKRQLETDLLPMPRQEMSLFFNNIKRKLLRLNPTRKNFSFIRYYFAFDIILLEGEILEQGFSSNLIDLKGLSKKGYDEFIEKTWEKLFDNFFEMVQKYEARTKAIFITEAEAVFYETKTKTKKTKRNKKLSNARRRG